MWQRDKKELQGSQKRISENTEPGLSSWPVKVLESIARIFALPEKSCTPESITESEIPCARITARGPDEPCALDSAKESEKTCSGHPVEKPCVVDPVKEPDRPRLTIPAKVLKRPHVIVPVKEEGVVVPPKDPEIQAERPVLPACCIVFSDTDNDVTSVRNTLNFAGIINAKGELADNLEGMTIFHTGDLIDKKNPDPSVVEYWQGLQQDALARGGDVRIIVGNHEQEIWQKIRAGEKCGVGAKKVRWLNEFIEDLDLFHVAGPVLFIHGYPTLEFLQALLHFKEVTGKDLNCFNADHYKKAFRSVSAMRQYAYVRDNRQPHYLLYDVADANRYYKRQGRMVGDILAQLKIDVVVHGHRPQRSGVQIDHEFGKWIPKVRMIGNDTMVRRRGLGATVIRATPGEGLEMVFINTKTKSSKLRRKVQECLRAPLVASRASRFTGSKDADIKSAAQG